MRHREKRSLSKSEMLAWRESVGGVKKAAELIAHALECSISKAEKIAGGRYPSLPTLAEQLAISSLMERPRDKVFPVASPKAKRKAS